MKRTALDAWLTDVGAADAFVALATLVQGAAVIVLDKESHVVHWSSEAERLLGISRDEVIGKPCPAEQIGCDPSASNVIFGERVKLRRVDQALVCVKHFARHFFSESGRLLGSVHLLHSQEIDAEQPMRMPEEQRQQFHGLISREPTMFHVFHLIKNVAETDVTVLIRGESGTGKELVAKAIHQESTRIHQPFVAVNCAAFTQTLLESELFGHVKGAFTGATQDRKGIFEQADGGTLFLDEVAELPLDTQAKLLRVLQERSFVPVGGITPRKVDVRVVAATHRSLREEVSRGNFREDLMYRLRVVPIYIPPLRERRSDIELLLNHFIDRQSLIGPRRVTEVAPEAMRLLLDHPWSGNVRELQNVVAYAFAVGRGHVIVRADLPPEFHASSGGFQNRSGAPHGTEAGKVKWALETANGDIAKAGSLLGVSRTTFWRMRKRHPEFESLSIL